MLKSLNQNLFNIAYHQIQEKPITVFLRKSREHATRTKGKRFFVF